MRAPAISWVGFAFAAAACSAAPAVRPAPSPAPIARAASPEPTQDDSVRLEDVQWTGNRVVTREELIADPSGPQSWTQTLSNDLVERTQQLYYDRGYLNVDVTKEFTPRNGSTRPHVLITVREGPRFHYGTIVVHEVDEAGHDVEPPGGSVALRALLPAQRGDWFSRGIAGRFIMDVRRAYWNLGYATVDTQLTLTPAGADVVDFELAIHRGPLVHVRRIDVRGLDRVPESIVRGLVEMNGGDVYSESRYQRTLRQLRALPQFDWVEMSTSEVADRPEQLDVLIEVHERGVSR